MPDEPAAGDAAGLRAANARLRALLAERDAGIAVLRGQLGELTALQAEASGLRERSASRPGPYRDLSSYAYCWRRFASSSWPADCGVQAAAAKPEAG